MNHSKISFGLAFIFIEFTTVCYASRQSNSKRPHPNIVFFLVDDLGWTDLACMGSRYYKTPSVDRLAGQGTLFTSAYSAHPVCGPTRVSLMTGKMPCRIDNTNTIGNLPSNEVTIAEAFKEHGYATFFAGKWHMGMSNGKSPDKQGFNEIIGVNYAGQPGSYFYPYKDIGQDWIGQKRRVINERDVLGLENGKSGEFLTDRLTDETIRFIEKNKDQPFFVYLSHYAVHLPLQAKKEYINQYSKTANELYNREVLKIDGSVYTRIRQSNPVYAANIQSMDESLGRIMDKLKELGLEQNTIIVFTSDNGGLSTQGGSQTQLPTSNLPLRYGKGWLYEGGIRVPAIMKFPSKVASGVKSDLPICSYDFYPTLLSLAGLPLKPEQHIDGKNIFKCNVREIRKRNMYWYFPFSHVSGHKPSAAIRVGEYKLILNLSDQSVKLFNIRRDISENNNLAVKRSILAQKMKNHLIDFIKKINTKPPDN